MGVKFDRILEGFDGPFEELKDEIAPPPGRVLDAEGAVGFFLHHRANDAFRAVNQLLAAGEEVRRLKEPFTIEGVKHPAGMFFVTGKDGTQARLEKIAQTLGTRFVGSKEAPGKEAVALKPARIGLWDRYGGSMPSGWTRWLMEQFDFPFEVVFPPELDKGNLREKFDVIVLVDGAISGGGRFGGGEAARPRTWGWSTNSGCPPSTAAAAAASHRPHCAAPQEVPRRRRHDRDHRRLDEPGERHSGCRWPTTSSRRTPTAGSGPCRATSSTCPRRYCG
jgi:hypothetical protein